MTEARVQRLHSQLYSEEMYPPLPPRIRLAANCWERVWWITLVDPIDQPHLLSTIAQRFNNEKITVRAQMRTRRRLCFAVTTMGLEEQNEFEIAMMLMCQLRKDIGDIERVEDRPVSMWPIDQFC